jgi:putative intracellular protease/amidase
MNMKGQNMNVNIILFDDFETLDAFGAAQIFGKAPEHFHINYFSMNGGIVNSVQGVKVWTDELGAVLHCLRRRGYYFGGK